MQAMDAEYYLEFALSRANEWERLLFDAPEQWMRAHLKSPRPWMYHHPNPRTAQEALFMIRRRITAIPFSVADANMLIWKKAERELLENLIIGVRQ